MKPIQIANDQTAFFPEYRADAKSGLILAANDANFDADRFIAAAARKRTKR